MILKNIFTNYHKINILFSIIKLANWWLITKYKVFEDSV